MFIVPLLTTFLGFLVILGNIVALGWFGMWMGLTSTKNSSAILKTILFVQVLPWFVVSFLSGLAVPLLLFRGMIGSASLMAFYPLILTGVSSVLYLAKDVIFWLWARNRLYAGFRQWVSVGHSRPMRSAPPPTTNSSEFDANQIPPIIPEA